MKCPVCGKHHDAAECPRCSFPDIQIMGDWDAEMEKLAPIIDNYRKNLMKAVMVALPVYHWKDEGGLLTQDKLQWVSLGSGQELLNTEVWSKTRYARIPGTETVQIPLRILSPDGSREITVTVPNPDTPASQELGAIIEDGCQVRLLLRSQGEPALRSEPVPLFA